MADTELTGKRREILDFIADQLRERGYPPSVREIGEAVGLDVVVDGPRPPLHAAEAGVSSAATRPSPAPSRSATTPPRAPPSSAGPPATSRSSATWPPGTDVLAQENVEELLPLPEDFTGDGQLFMLRVRGDSMIDAGILDGDYVVVRQQPEAERGRHRGGRASPGEEATVKTYTRKGNKVVLMPANPLLEPMVFDPADVTVFGKVVTVLRRL